VTSDPDRFQRAVALFAQENAQDPRTVLVDGTPVPQEMLATSHRVAWLERVAPEASEALRLAAHCQHLSRWTVPRSTYPEGRSGYLRWRQDLARLHADHARGHLLAVGYDEQTVGQVTAILTKQQPRTSPDTQAMEDALCLSFLAHDFETFSTKHDDEALVTILAKSLRKMSARGLALAATITLSERGQRLLQSAVQSNQQAG
jgi:hypothetical protein